MNIARQLLLIRSLGRYSISFAHKHYLLKSIRSLNTIPIQNNLYRHNDYEILKQSLQQFSISHKRLVSRKPTQIEENEEEEEDDDDEEENDENEDQILKGLNRNLLPKGYKIIIKYISSLRLDLICSSGTGIGRSQIEEEFYGSKLRINGEKSTKKAQQVKEGDVIDLVMARLEGAKYQTKRIILYKIFNEKTLKGKVKVCLITWRSGVIVDGSKWS